MRIFVHDYAGHPFQVKLSHQLAHRGHEVAHAYFSADSGPKGTLRLQPDDPATLGFVAIEIDGNYDKASLIQRRFNDVAYGKNVGHAISEFRPDIVISGNTPPDAQTHVIEAADSLDIPFVYWLQDFYSEAVTAVLDKKFGYAGRAVGRYYRWMERKQLEKSSAIVIITEDFRAAVSAGIKDDSKVVTIENWGAVNDITPSPKDNAWSRERGLASRFTFLYSGTLGLKHNPELLLEVSRALGANASVVAVAQGAGLARLTVEKQSRGLDSLRVFPVQPFETLSAVLATADVLLATIEADASGYSVPSKVMSYLCAGRPILLAAPAENLAARILGRENAGLVVAPDDVGGFVQAAIRLQDDAALRRELGANGRAYAERAFNIERITDKFEEVFWMALARKKNRDRVSLYRPTEFLGGPPLDAASRKN